MANLECRPTYAMVVENGLSHNEGTGNDQLTSADSTIQSMPLYRLQFPDNERLPKDYVHYFINGYNSQIPKKSEKLSRYYTDEFAEIYGQTISIKLSTALYPEVVESEVNITNYISFYYADDGTAFVQTSGNASCGVLKYADVQLTHQVVRTLLGRFGDAAFQQVRCKEFERVAYLRSDASIRSPELNCFENPEGPIMVKVGITFIQFECNIKKHGMKNFINHLNGICNGSNTTTGAKEIGMSKNFIRNIHIQFRQFLHDHLITARPFVLPILWTNVAKTEPDYNKLYMGHPEFLVGDDCLYTGDVELFDLMRYNASTQCVCLYFVKKNLNRTIRELAFQVMSAVDILRNMWNKDGLAMLQEFYECIRKKYEKSKRHLPELFDDFEKFKNMLSKISQNKLKIICAVFDKAGEHDSIRRERDAKDHFGVRDIREAYRKLSKGDQSMIRKNLHRIYSDSCHRTESELIFRLLIDKGFVNASGEGDLGCSTCKLLFAQRQKPSWAHYFKIGEQPDFDGIIWKIVKPFSTLFKSTAAKYSLMHMQECGYEFNICQIRQ